MSCDEGSENRENLVRLLEEYRKGLSEEDKNEVIDHLKEVGKKLSDPLELPEAFEFALFIVGRSRTSSVGVP